jgi:RimJ/RimL family protein N-acetyltransferase
MMNEFTHGKLFCRGKDVILRDAVPADADQYVRWMQSGEWREYDAPWEFESDPPSENILRGNFMQRFLYSTETPRRRMIIATPEARPLGWVNRYSDARFQDVWMVGICICVDEYLGQGLGRQALRLWIDYLFSSSNIHRIGLFTYSFNARMIRVAERLGFTAEGVDREVIKWKGNWVNRLHYGLLRQEWEALQRMGGRDL